MSNFRAVKRVTAVVEIFARVRRTMPASLVMVGNGPDAGAAARVARQRGVADDVHFLGEQEALVPLLSAADVFLLPSTQESFGLAALEAMTCGVPEVVEHGVTGFLHPPDDLDGMTQSVRELLTDDELRRRVGDAAARVAHGRFCEEMIVPRYEAYYAELLARPGRS